MFDLFADSTVLDALSQCSTLQDLNQLLALRLAFIAFPTVIEKLYETRSIGLSAQLRPNIRACISAELYTSASTACTVEVVKSHGSAEVTLLDPLAETQDEV